MGLMRTGGTMMTMTTDDPLTPLPRPTFQLIARVRRIDKKLYGMRLYRKTLQKDVDESGFVGHLIFRDDEWAQIVPGLRSVDVIIDYVADSVL